MLRESSDAVGNLLAEGCQRNVPAELHYETADRNMVTGRVRLLALTDSHVLTDAPVLLEGDEAIPCGKKITVHIQINGRRYQFQSRIEDDRRLVPLNARQTVPGLALARPTEISESQRRGHFRISLVAYDPVNVDLAYAEVGIPDACSLSGGVVRGWLVDLSVGGVSVMLDGRITPRAATGDRFYLSFQLPEMSGPFYMLGSVRHWREVPKSKSVRIGFSFRAWGGSPLVAEQQRLSRFISSHERRVLRRRK
jgi:c-di-GMP-binding flagellar brake protein YcgR